MIDGGSLSRQLLLRLLSFSLLLLLFTALLNGWISYRDESDRQRNEIKAVVAAYGVGLGKAVWELDEEAVRLQLTGLQHFPALLSAEVVSRDLKLSYAKPGANQSQAGETLSFPLRAPQGSEVIADFRLRLDNATLRTLVSQQTARFVLVVAVELLMLAVLIFWLVRRSVSVPVRALSRHVHELKAENLDQAAPMPASARHNELHQLAQGITRLQGELREQFVHRDAAAAELAQQRDQLNHLFAQQARQLDDVLHNMADGAGVLDGAGDIVFANPSWCRMLGVASGSAAIGSGPRIWLASPSWDELLARIATEGAVIACQLSTRSAESGLEVPVEASFSVIERNSNGSPARIQIMLRDITARLETERNLIAAREAALQTARAKSDFLANMSHEIRTPMNAIIGMTDLALRTELTPRQAKFLSTARQAAQSLLGIINDILDFSKIEAGKLELERAPFSPESLLQEVAAVIGLQAGRKGLEFLLETADDIPRTLIGDERRLRQVLINLCNNAVKFTDSGEIMVIIERLGDAASGRVTVRFTIRDTGIGIAPDQLGKLFKPFIQVDGSTTRKFGGTGLGLAISRQLLNLMGGEIDVVSEPGKGSAFQFDLVFDAEPEILPANEVPTAEVSLRVLVVDDNASARHIATSLLRRLDCKSTAVDSALAALAELEKPAEAQAFDLVLMDWKMPDIEGFDAAQRIRALPGLAHPPRIVLMTAFGDDETRQRASREGLDGYLTKPMSLSNLRETIAAVRRQMIENTPVSPPPDAEAARLRGQIAGLRVLVVEDNAFNQELALEILSQAQVSVTLAENGEEALTHATSTHFDAVLMDVQMPVMDGFEATRRIRSVIGLARLPIIAMTAHALPADRERCLAAGMNDCVTKPFAEIELIAALARWAGNARDQAVGSRSAPQSRLIERH